MIDLHTHVLPGLDDGPADIAGSLALARLAHEHGTRTMVATPHVREDHHYDLDEIPERAAALNAELARNGIDVEVVTGGEVAISKAAELDDDQLAAVCIDSGPYLLVESPYVLAPELLEEVLFRLQTRGFRPILAHPERSPSFLSDLVRLERIVERGVLCSVTALSMAGGFGEHVRRFTTRLFSRGLVHNVASDAHDTQRRPPGLLHGFERLHGALPGLADHVPWYTVDAPRAILSGSDLPNQPAPVAPTRKSWRRILALAGSGAR